LSDEREDGHAPAIADALARAHERWRQGARGEAIAALESLAASRPVAPVLARLGAYALESGDAAAAERWLTQAVSLASADAAAWTNLGTAHLRRGRTGDAIAAYRRALELSPQALGARVNLANALQQVGNVDGAVAQLEDAVRAAPELPEIRNNLGNLYKEQGRFDDAWAAYLAARVAQPEFRPAFSNLLALTKVSPRHAPEEIFALHRAFAERFEPGWRASYVPPPNVPDPSRRLAIGYVSPDCHTALPPFVEPVLRRHDRARFDVFVYFNNAQPDAALARLGPVTARVMAGLSDEDVAQTVRRDGIDILVDIAGHTGHNRLGVFGRRPAPVQITWLDYLQTTGLDAIDYRITDAVADPPGVADRLHSETLLRIAPAQWCWEPPRAMDEASPLPALERGHLTLGSFNAGAKLTDATLALWARLLDAIPDATLEVVGVPEGFAQARVLRAFGDAASRVRVNARVAPDAFRALVRGVDVALDPSPFSGATTTLEVLWQGVPVVSRPGATSASRSTASILAALGLDDWCAHDDGRYVAIVAAAGRDLPRLAALRAALPARVAQSPLCDAAAFTRRLEDLCAGAWRQWCADRADAEAGRTARAPSDAPRSAARRRVDLDARVARLDAAIREGRAAAHVDAACALVADAPEWDAARRAYLQTMLAWARTRPGLVARTFPPPARPARPPRISVVICSIDRPRFESAVASYRTHFAGHDVEIVGVHDARSLAEGYNRAASRAHGDVLVFSHDDIALLTPDFGDRLVAHLDGADGVGVAGASVVTTPVWSVEGAEAIHGHVLHAAPKNRGGVLMLVGGFQAPVCTGVRVLDGVFVAVRRHVWERTRFDPDRFDGFHLYDLDFTWRASAAGARLVVPADLTLFHASLGRYDEVWRRYARRFCEVAGLDPLAPPRPGGLQARLDTMEQVDLLRAALVHHRFGAPRGHGAAQGPPL